MTPCASNVEVQSEPPEFAPEPNLRDLPRTIFNLPRLVVLGLIRLYQATFSRDLTGGYLSFLSDLFALWLSGHL